MMILRGSLFFPTMIKGGGLWKISYENDIEHREDQPFFSRKRKENENMLLDALIISFQQNVDTELEYET